MPKPIQPPAPAYGSPEWKAERARMVGTPEWRAANQTPNATLESGQTGGFIPGNQFGVFVPAGKTYTTAQKQDVNPLYNPLYDPRSTEYQQNLVNTSQPRQSIQNPLVQPPNAPVATPQIQPFQPQTQPQAPIAPQQQAAPQITLPQQFQQNYNMGPSATPNQGIKMPNIPKQQGFGGGSNWTDFLTVAHNRNLR